MDVITKKLVDDFVKSYELSVYNGDDQFEHFCNYCVVSKEYGETFDVEQIWLGDKALGIDGIAIIVNGKLVENKETVEDLINFNKYLEATFIFIEAKRSSNFDSADIGNFLFGVSDFFDENPKLPRSDSLKEKAAIKEYIFSQSSRMRDSPVCKLYYATTGNWTNDKAIEARFDTGKQDLLQTNLFSGVFIKPLDARALQKYYQEIQSAISREIIFEKKSVIPEIKDVQESYIGLLNFKEFIKLITDNDGKIIGSIFYDNVRAFQGDNPVNSKIKETLEKRKFDMFPILNNGITIVAKSLKVSADKFVLTNYSIVNGCQTSHILYDAKDTEGINNMFIPVRLVVTDKDEIKNEVITATNNQTAVKIEQLQALTDYQKRLEAFYKTTEGDLQLFYERLDKQFNTDPSIIKTRIITITIQIKAFAAMYLKEPHLVSRFYGRIAKYLGEKIFLESHDPIVYYACGLAFFRLDQLFRGHLDPKYKKCRYHLLMLLPYLIDNIEQPKFDSNKIQKYCQNIINQLNSTEKSLEIFKKATEIIDESGVDIEDREIFKLQQTNDKLLGIIENN